MSSRNHSPNFLSSRRILSFSGFWLCFWHRIAAAAAAAAAAFRGGRVLPASWRQRFPDARLKIHLRFNVVRILWALPVIFHGRLWRFATQIIEVFFLFAQWWTVIHNPRLIRIQKRHSEMFDDGTCTGGWFWVHSRNFSLMTTVNHFVNDCPYFNFHHFHTSDCSREHSAGCTPTFGGGGCPSMQQIGLSLPFVFVYLLHDLLSFLFHFRLFIWTQHCLGRKIFCLCFSVSRGMRLWDRSPDSSEPFVTLDSRSSLIRTTFGVHNSFFPGSHLRVSRTSRSFRVTWRILSHRYAVPRGN